MIDCHCHLEQKEIYYNLNNLIPKFKKKLKFIISSCAHQEDLDKTLNIYSRFKPFVKICIGLHPQFIKEIKEKDIEKVILFIKEHKNVISGIGEIGLDYHWIKELLFREKQKSLFIRFIKLAQELHLPLIIHSWDSTLEAIEILEKQGLKGKKVLMHFLNRRLFPIGYERQKSFDALAPR